MHLRAYQEEVLEEMRILMRRGIKKILLTMPPGAGKTLTTATMLRNSAYKGLRSWFNVHRRELIYQSIAAFEEVGVIPSVISSGFLEDRNNQIQVCSVQTLLNRYALYPEPQLIVWDECHHIAAKSWNKIYAAFPDAYHIGLTATPQRLDGTGLGAWFESMVRGPDTAALIKMGFLSPYRMYAPFTPNLSGVHSRLGDYVKSELTDAVDKPSITGSAVIEYRKHCEGKRAIIFCVSIEHSKRVAEQFQSAFIPTLHVDGDTPKEKRDESIRLFKNGQIKCLTNVDLFGEGFDVPATEDAILLRPTQSLGLYLQQCGRALRVHPGKRNAIILDHAGNAQRHGLVSDLHQWSLNASRKKNLRTSNGEIKVRICPHCFAAQSPGPPCCAFCFTDFPITPREVEEVDGELIEITEAKKKKRKQVGQARTLQALLKIQHERGYKPGWAYHVYHSRQGRR